MTGLLVRVGIDGTFGGWNAPVASDNEFVYVPKPEEGTPRLSLALDYSAVLPALEQFRRKHGGGALARLRFPVSLKEAVMHLDPDFEWLTYGDRRQRGNAIRKLVKGDIIAFYAGLRPLEGDRLVYALIGLYVVGQWLPASEVPPSRWRENAHTRRVDRENSIVLRAQEGVSGRLARCIPIGEWRDRAYRVRCDLLREWGGISAKDGYIQRSGTLPSFCDTERFCQWFGRQRPVLLKANN